METGTKISASVHVALIGFLLLGNPFRSEPLPIAVQEVAVISAADFDTLLAAQEPPEAQAQVSLPTPEQEATPPELPEATSAAPELPETDTTSLPEPAPDDLAVLVPDRAPEPVPQPAPRVAPEPVAEPEPEATPDPDTREAIAEDGESDAPKEAPQDATAPEAATTEIVTEADEPTAPTESPRPPVRPDLPQVAAAPVPEAAPDPDPEPEADPLSDAIADAVASAQDSAQEPALAVPSGPPLTSGEREGLRVSVSSCWNVGALSSEAQETRVTVYVAMNRDGTPQTDTIRMMEFTGGSEGAARRVFETARRAIIRCGARGFPLPVDKFGQWQEIEMTFNPEGMFWR